MYIMDDNTFIFYDTQAKSFRIIKERWYNKNLQSE
jgi:hypothetical protein